MPDDRQQRLAQFGAWAASNGRKDAHAVLAAYGFDAKSGLLTQLLALNLEVAGKIDTNQPVTAPCVPPSYAKSAGNPADLLTPDCIAP